jgi:hypothetical protein
MDSSRSKLQKYRLENLTVEELTLLLEEADDRLKEKPLDSRALSDYNMYSMLIRKLENA